jgi:hypothetical protein
MSVIAKTKRTVSSTPEESMGGAMLGFLAIRGSNICKNFIVQSKKIRNFYLVVESMTKMLPALSGLE